MKGIRAGWLVLLLLICVLLNACTQLSSETNEIVYSRDINEIVEAGTNIEERKDPFQVRDGFYTNEDLGFHIEWPGEWMENVKVMRILTEDTLHFYFIGQSDASHTNSEVGLYLFSITSESTIGEFGHGTIVELGKVDDTKFFSFTADDYCSYCMLKDKSASDTPLQAEAREADWRKLSDILAIKDSVLRSFESIH